MVKTIKISDECHRELTKVLGEFMAQNPDIKTYEQAILKLIEFYKMHREK